MSKPAGIIIIIAAAAILLFLKFSADAAKKKQDKILDAFKAIDQQLQQSEPHKKAVAKDTVLQQIK